MTTKYLQNGNGYGAQNPTVGVVQIKATATGTAADSHGVNRTVYNLVEAIDGSTLATGSFAPLKDSCRLLRQRGEHTSLSVEVRFACNDGAFRHPQTAPNLMHGYAYIGAGS